MLLKFLLILYCEKKAREIGRKTCNSYLPNKESPDTLGLQYLGGIKGNFNSTMTRKISLRILLQSSLNTLQNLVVAQRPNLKKLFNLG